jgi:hypothetical protein
MSAIAGVHVPVVRAAATAAVLATLGVVLVGLAMAAGLVGTGGLAGPGPLARGPEQHRIGDDVETSFGIVAVEFVRSVDGLSSRSLAGATHGVPGLIDTGHTRIQAALSVTNRRPEPLQFSVDQVRLRVTLDDRTTVQGPVGGDLPDARVLANAGIEGHLDFVVPRDGARLALLFRDPASSTPVVINLGRTDFATASSGEHTH